MKIIRNAFTERRNTIIVLIFALGMIVIGWAATPTASVQEVNGSNVALFTEVPSKDEIMRQIIGVREGKTEVSDGVAPGGPAVANAIRALTGCTTNTLPATDDGSSAAITLPFPINYFGTTRTQTYVNNNGNITFTGSLGTFTPFALTSTNVPIIAPFFADVDTRGTGSGLVQYGNTSVGGRAAFCVNWVNVGYFNSQVNKLNSFQLILIDRSDTGAGDFDMEFNYNQIVWETGNSSGGTNGLGGNSARAGYANGTMAAGTFLEFSGSAVNGGLLDTNMATGVTNNSFNSGVTGRYIFGARNGVIPTPTPTPTPTPPLVVTQHLTTAGPIPDACGSPTAKSSFTTLDPTALQWTTVTGFQNGSVVRWEWVQPNGSIFKQFEGAINNPNSNVCFWDGMSIAGTPAAALLGNWQVRVFYNGGLIATTNFTISTPPPPVVLEHLTTAGPIPDGCGTPTAKTSFTYLDATALQWTSVSGHTNGSIVRWEWVQPNGSIFKQFDGTINNTNSNICFFDGMSIAGTPAAQLLGNWQVRVFYNGGLIATDNFTISAPPPPNVFEHLTTAGPIPNGCGTPAAKTNYTTLDATVLQWTSISGNLNGSIVRWEWVQPNGSIFKQFDGTINNTNPNICINDGMSIAGTPAAALLGNWQVRVFYNNVLIATDNFTISAPPPPNVFEHLTTAGPIPNGCGTPTAKTNFTTVDATVLQWTSVSGNLTGSVVRWEWVQPNGSIFKQYEGTIHNPNSNICFFDGMSIAGTPAAALAGNWQVRVFYNGGLIATDNFTITAVPPPNVFEHLTTAGPIPGGCATPTAKTSFSASDATVLQWTSISGHQNGSIVRWEWVQPNGTIFKQFQAPINNTNSNICFWDGMSIAGTDAAGLPGNWQVRVFYNGSLIATDNFTIGAGGPTADCGKPSAVLTTFGNVVVFPDALASNTPQQKLVTGLPGGNGTQGISYYGSDHVLVMDAQITAHSRGIFVIQVSTGTLLDTINPGTGFNGTGTIAVAPDSSAALAMGGTSTLFVIRAPFNASSAVERITLPGSFHTGQTQGIVFDQAGRAFVAHTQGVAVLDPPYNSVAFNIPSGPGIAPIAITPDGKTLLLGSDSAGPKIRIIKAPFSATSVVENLALPAGQSIAGIMVTPDGTKALAVGFPRAVFAISVPFTSSSTIESLPLPPSNGQFANFEDVGISADGQIAIATGGDPPSEAPVFIRAPFTAAGAQSYYVPIEGGIGRNRGAVRFQPACRGGTSPTGATNGKIAFRSQRDDNAEIYTMDPDGSNQTRLTNNTAIDTSPTWSPDGTKIAFSSLRNNNRLQIWVMNADGSNPERLTTTSDADFGPDWSPDGTKIVFTSNRDNNDEIYVMDANGANQTRLTNHSASDRGPTWSPDGTKIAFTSRRDGNDKIYIMDATGSNPTRLTSNSTSEDVSAWSPDGTKIAFMSGGDDWEIFVVDANGSNQTQLTNNSTSDQNPAWSPDGTKLVFQSDRDGFWDIYVMDANGGNQTRLTNNSVDDTGPNWGRQATSGTPVPTPGGPPGLTADYQFQNTRDSSDGGPPLTDLITGSNAANSFTTESIEGCTPRQVLNFPKGNGLTLVPTTGLTTDNKTYTIVMLFKFLEQNTNRAIIDFRNFPTDDRGPYAAPDNNLNFYNAQNNGVGISSGIDSPLTANKWVQVVFTRQESDLDGKDADVGYVDGVHQYKLESNGADGILDPQSNTLRFFLNPVQPENTAYSAGSVARIRIFNRALSKPEVEALDRLPGGACGTPSPSPSPSPSVSPLPSPSVGPTPLPTPTPTPSPSPGPVPSLDMIGLTRTGELVRFNTANAGSTVSSAVPITGTSDGFIRGIDVRPANGVLYALVGQEGTAGNLYTVNQNNGTATLVGALGVTLNAGSYGFDFDPVADVIRVIGENGENLSVNPSTGVATIQTPVPANFSINAAAFTNNIAGAATTTLYTLDNNADALNIQNPPASGTQTVVGPLGTNPGGPTGFEIATADNAAFAVFDNAAQTGAELYRINLTTGAATFVSIVNTPHRLRGLTILPSSGPPGLTADYQFQNTRDSSGGGPPLTDLIKQGNGANTFTTEAIEGCAPRSVLSFPKGNGLTLVPTTGLTTDNKTYSIVVLFKFTEQDHYRAIVDFKNGLQTPRGVYANPENKLQFINSTSDAVGRGVGINPVIPANKYVQVVLTRQGSDENAGRKGIETGYVDDAVGPQYILDHDNDDGVIHPQFNMLRFFFNETANNDVQNYSAGSVARIRLFNRVLTASEVAALDRLPGGACSTPTPTPTASPTPSPTPGGTPNPTPTPGVTPTPTPGSTPTPTPSPSPTGTPPTGTVTFPGTNLGDIPDGSCAGDGRQVQFTVSGVTGPISDIRVSLTGTHTYVGDLDALLIGPGNTASEFLFTFTGNDITPQFGDSSDLNGTYTFFDSAPNNWWTAAAAVDGVTAIAPGAYKPSNALGQVVSFDQVFGNIANPNGIWILKVNDCWAPDTGTITAASLKMTGVARISGRVLTPSGLGLKNANVSLIDSQGVRRTVPTSNLGFYIFENVRIGEQYTLSVSSRRFRFASRTETFAGVRSDVDFVGIE